MQYAGYFYNRDKPKALKLFAKVAEMEPEFPPVYNVLGYCYKDTGDKTKAEEAFRKSIKLDPNSPNGYDSLAELLLSMGRYQESIAQYDKALEVEPLFPSAQIGVASNLCLLGDYHAARERLNKLFDIAPHDGIRSGIHWALSVTYADQGDFKGALTELDKNFQISKKNNDVTAMRVDLFNQATVLLAAGRPDDAAKACKEAIELVRGDEKAPARNKAFSEALYTWWEGRIAAEQNNLHKAADKLTAFFEAVEALNAPNFKKSGYDLRGTIQLKSEQYAEALESFKQGNEHDPIVMYYTGLAYQGLGQHKQANKMFDYVINANSPLSYSFSFARRLAAKSKKGHHGS
nr:tetratricopeptide repeat protein [Acanthopleuribacter pedis]